MKGLYEESHGIMQNFMYDPQLNEKFSYVASESQTHKWFGQNNMWDLKIKNLIFNDL